MRKHRCALAITAFAVPLTVLSITGALNQASANQEIPWKSSAPSPTTPLPAKLLQFDPKLASFQADVGGQFVQPQVYLQKEETFSQAVVNQEEQTYLAAVNQQNAQEQYASQTKSGSTSQANTTTAVPVPSEGDGLLSCIAQAESGGDPTIYNESGSGASGLYQFMPGTWDDYDGYANAADAPAAVQTQKAEEVVAEDGYSPWTGDPCVG